MYSNNLLAHSGRTLDQLLSGKLVWYPDSRHRAQIWATPQKVTLSHYYQSLRFFPLANFSTGLPSDYPSLYDADVRGTAPWPFVPDGHTALREHSPLWSTIASPTDAIRRCSVADAVSPALRSSSSTRASNGAFQVACQGFVELEYYVLDADPTALGGIVSRKRTRNPPTMASHTHNHSGGCSTGAFAPGPDYYVDIPEHKMHLLRAVRSTLPI